ncbi:MAG TPA: DUF2127 domain-containing protein, partial [Terriglobales bacterium]|nr:DUF2127 domain-containing protein [Terriglobales bacterium]
MISGQPRPIDHRLEHRARMRALRTVALLELGKGLLVLAAAFSVWFWVDPSHLAEWFLNFLHISPDRHLAHLLLKMADSLSNARMWVIMLTACSYSGLRFAEAYGLWKARAWAEWIALVSGAIYLPFEIRLLVHGVTLFHAGVLM